VLNDGTIIADGSPHVLKQQVGGRLELSFSDGPAFESALRLLARRALSRDRAALTISVATDGDAARVRALLDEIDPRRDGVRSFAVHDASLDAVFLTLMQKETSRV
jgi:ABC-2 type transport system ATP-binding protein